MVTNQTALTAKEGLLTHILFVSLPCNIPIGQQQHLYSWPFGPPGTAWARLGLARHRLGPPQPGTIGLIT
jgi:hypothetical protein